MKVYPRVCGGTSRRRSRRTRGGGLSPRVRGNPTIELPVANAKGSIPACAGEPITRGRSPGQPGVYPRVCGGTRTALSHPESASGLSPRVRGNQSDHPHVRASAGSIPACAGEPPAPKPGRSIPRVYPRVCGGTIPPLTTSTASPGLSPRVRGNRRTRHPAPVSAGSIPACAGEPSPGGPCRSCWPVYPRVCGGTIVGSWDSRAVTGLSPRVRGNRSAKQRASSSRRSIPACAGEPRSTPSSDSCSGVYPRVCGGTSCRGMAGSHSEGLSPRVRGNRIRHRPSLPNPRSIPACAGEPMFAILRCHAPRVYPRVCGGTAFQSMADGIEEGLSPRVRGNRDDGGADAAWCGSIPACAGEPWWAARAAIARRVYPRVCGGTLRYDPETAPGLGLSPRVRGNQGGDRPAVVQGRSIPACAGEPPPPAWSSPVTRVYPRVCGGTDGEQGAPDLARGLSPRVRGNPGRKTGAGATGGSIPACAGEPTRTCP